MADETKGAPSRSAAKWSRVLDVHGGFQDAGGALCEQLQTRSSFSPPARNIFGAPRIELLPNELKRLIWSPHGSSQQTQAAQGFSLKSRVVRRWKKSTTWSTPLYGCARWKRRPISWAGFPRRRADITSALLRSRAGMNRTNPPPSIR